MARSLASFPENQRLAIATRRLNGMTMGNGYWGAVDYYHKMKLETPQEKAARAALRATLNKKRKKGEAKETIEKLAEGMIGMIKESLKEEKVGA